MNTGNLEKKCKGDSLGYCFTCKKDGTFHIEGSERILRDGSGRVHGEDHVTRPWSLEDIVKDDGHGHMKLVPQRIAEMLLSPQSPLDIVTFKDNGDIVTYDRAADTGIWQLMGEQEIERVVTEIIEICDSDVREQLTRYAMAEIIASIKWNTYMDRKKFTSPPWKIPLLNGVYDIKTNILEPHRQENRFLYQVPIKYDANATCPKIDEFFDEVLGDRKMVAYEVVGYALCANAESRPNKWQRAFMFLGPGDNGKSTTLNLQSMILGDENVSTQTLQALVEERFSVASLDHKLANIAADIGDKSLYATAQFKNLTGGDPVKAEHKFKDSYSFYNRAILIFSCNILPETYDDTDAYHKRWVIIAFENTFSGDKKDPEILDKISTPEELSGFFNKCIVAYREMSARGRFTTEGETVEKKREYYTRMADPVQCFIDDCILFDPDGMVNKQHLLAAFRAYAQAHKYGKYLSEKRFRKMFRDKAGERLYEAQVKDAEGIPRRTYKGIKLVDEAAPSTSSGSSTFPYLNSTGKGSYCVQSIGNGDDPVNAVTPIQGSLSQASPAPPKVAPKQSEVT